MTAVQSLHLRFADRVVGLFRPSGGDAERGQAVVRLVLVPLFCLYTVPILLVGNVPPILTIILVAYFISYVPISALLYAAIVRWPGNFPARRFFGMANDYLCMLLAMSVGGATTLPVYATLLWVTVGNGLRFGPRYLIGATCVALAVIVMTTYLNTYWRQNPYLVLTFMLTAIIVPAYVLSLLTRINKAYSAAMEANLAKSRFLAQASHDLRQPIHAISLFTACLYDAGLGSEERQMVENIDRSLQSVSRLFRSLLDISTLDSGRLLVRNESVAIADLLEDLSRQNSEAAQWANTVLRTVPCNLTVRFDRGLVTTMLQNIVTNALKYAPDAPILIGCRRRQGKLSIEVYDRGPGISIEHLPHVFDEFYQIRERGDKDTDGVGLGLSIVRRLGILLNLQVTIRSTRGKGTVVIIDGIEILSKPSVSESATRRPVHSPFLLDGLRVLLVEDDQDVLSATSTLLTKWGCIVQISAVEPGVRTECDILIADYDLGDARTGADCIAQVRLLNGAKVPAIIMTGHDEGRVRDDLEDPGVPILLKPVRPAELRSVLTAMALQLRDE
ncbi:hybrid sensor histidine kinase/response regulator [Pararhizobium sp.]|uniref:hybrid sensor histidine kinase/response regulator n=1 Tax=Pararhizobium sp. TaxID=1977563 RepID=UPI003D0EBD8A